MRVLFVDWPMDECTEGQPHLKSFLVALIQYIISALIFSVFDIL